MNLFEFTRLALPIKEVLTCSRNDNYTGKLGFKSHRQHLNLFDHNDYNHASVSVAYHVTAH